MNKIYINASDLCKKSAMIMCWHRKNFVKKVVTPGMIEGNKAAEQRITSKYVEMAGYRNILNDIMISFCIDEVQIIENSCPQKQFFIEHKSVRGNIEQWYFEASLIQAAYYAALVSQSKVLETATFLINQGKEKLKIEISKSRQYYLNFGGVLYKIKLLKPKFILTYFDDKAYASLEYNTARIFDAENKYNEKIKKYFTYEKENIN